MGEVCTLVLFVITAVAGYGISDCSHVCTTQWGYVQLPHTGTCVSLLNNCQNGTINLYDGMYNYSFKSQN